jgi:hypothetical protein
VDADPEQVHHALAARGFWICDGALDPAFAESLDEELGERPLALNVNDVGPVRYHHQTYFTHALASSRRFFDLVTHPSLRAKCRAHLGDQFRLKCQRYYQSGLHHELTWHTDDKSPLGERTGVAGVGVVMYLRDTYEGELQVLDGSNQWSGSLGRTEFTDEEVLAKYGEKIVTISRPAGTVIIFDSRILHRTRPIRRRGFIRKSVFLQVDADMAHSEKIILDAQYLEPSDEELLRYLGVGLPSGYPAMPPSGLATLNNSDLRKVIFQSVKTLALRNLAGPVYRAARAVWRRARFS